jgi:hypothetical protein
VAWRVITLAILIDTNFDKVIQMTTQKDLIVVSARRIPILLFILLALLLAACNGKQNDSLADRSFITSQPCAAPCWYGLEPDKSDREEVYATLHQLPFVDPASISEWATTWQNDEQAIGVGWSCLPKKKDSCGGGVTLSENKLKRLSLSVDYTLTFSDTVEKLGVPSHIFYVDAFWRGECYIQLFWFSKGISVGGRLPDICSSEAMKGAPLNPNVQVSDVNYWSPAVVQELIANDNRYLAWPGFKESGFSFFDFVSGGISTWLLILFMLGIVVVLALWKRHWPTPAISFVLAAIAMIGPTIRLQFSDVITPMCGTYFINVLLCGTVYYVIAEAARRVWARRAGATAVAKDDSVSST